MLRPVATLNDAPNNSFNPSERSEDLAENKRSPGRVYGPWFNDRQKTGTLRCGISISIRRLCVPTRLPRRAHERHG